MTGSRCGLPRIVVFVALSLWTRVVAAQQIPESASPDSSAASARSSRSQFLDPVDGWFDISGFLDTGHGFVPVAVPVTEPAVGYGVGGALVFIQRNPPLASGAYRRPNMTAVGGMGTENGTWATFAAHLGSWREDRLHTFVAGLYGSIELDFYGIGDGALNDHPVHYQLEPGGGVARALYRIGESRFQAGLAYGIASIRVSFDDDATPSEVSSEELDSRIAGLVPTVVYDTRNNAFTPIRGIYVELGSGLFAAVLGGTSNFEKINFTGIYHHPVSSTVFLGARAEGSLSFNDTPFYARPFIHLRGAPLMRYIGEHAASLEIETRWQFWRRFSAVGFAGTGIAWNDFDQFENEQTIVTGGGGLRYELARRYGLHMGLDVGWSPDDTALYIQFGSAWFRP